jgi:ribonucleoside-diphosphate reductase alpha chain
MTRTSSAPPETPRRHKLPDDRLSVTHEFMIGPERASGVVTVGLYENGEPGEIFAKFDHLGSREGALLDAWCVMVSIGLQCGMPLDVVIDKFRGWTFDPSGMTWSQDIPFCSSTIDYIVRWLELRFLNRKGQADD